MEGWRGFFNLPANQRWLEYSLAHRCTRSPRRAHAHKHNAEHTPVSTEKTSRLNSERKKPNNITGGTFAHSAKQSPNAGARVKNTGRQPAIRLILTGVWGRRRWRRGEQGEWNCRRQMKWKKACISTAASISSRELSTLGGPICDQLEINPPHGWPASSKRDQFSQHWRGMLLDVEPTDTRQLRFKLPHSEQRRHNPPQWNYY